ncbi:Carnitine O-acetyltransferase mitochondrial [Turnera subulata]|uniref:catalase n=1 Tax=Turnera subulata TaxID=218843 RepID=A0A9Q0F5Y1_9ROSI|nr:Carnitine O-acetyltransferase mitochondrial [Turnera subulata]
MDPYKYIPSDDYDSKFLTTNAGEPVYSDDSSLTVGTRGPILLEDYQFIEKLAHLSRERIPERVLHARGVSAKGFFEVTHDVTDVTMADFLRAPGVQTPLMARFSVVVHERGSPETLREPRGFAVKIYTREGNYDLVGINSPVFVIRDPMKFPDIVHAFKPNPKNNIQEMWRVFDFLSHHPESLHALTYFFDDAGIPLNYRHMNGFGVHAFTLINKDGKVVYVKFHWISSQGVKSLMDDEAVKVGGANHSHATQDLYDSIEAGDFPEWKLYIQTMDPDDEDKYDFDPLDVTKIWPEDKFPLRPVGRMVLNKNVDNFFSEAEMLAFDPAHVVPGIYYSDDKLLQGRLFAYGDAQRYRLGANYLLLPVNAPKIKYHNNNYDGFMNFTKREEQVNYYPSWYDNVHPAKKYPTISACLSGRRERREISKQNNFKQPGERFRSFDPARQERFVQRFGQALSDPRTKDDIRKTFVSYCFEVEMLITQCINIQKR